MQQRSLKKSEGFFKKVQNLRFLQFLKILGIFKGFSKKYWYFSCFKTKINTKHEKRLVFNKEKHTSDQCFSFIRYIMPIFRENLGQSRLFFREIQPHHAYFFSDLAQFHAQSMLIFFSNLTQSCLFSILSNLGFSKKQWYFLCFKTKINTQHKKDLYLIKKNTLLTSFSAL